jgi:hypothetical protein
MSEGETLSAPEVLVLTSLPRYSARKAVKVGLLALLVQGLLRIDQEERPGLLRKRRIAHMRTAREAAEPLPPSTASLLGVVRAAQSQDGTMPAVVAAARQAFGKELDGFVRHYVFPSLIERGLAEPRRTRWLGLVPVTRHYPTAAGEAERRRLEEKMQQAREIPRYLDRDPAQAVALAAR